MADVFISYARSDQSLADSLAAVFRRVGASVWYDQHIHPAENFVHRIEEELILADRVVVLWSFISRNSRWVCDEAGEGLRRGKLVQVTLDGEAPPIGFGRHVQHITDLSGFGTADWQTRAERFARSTIAIGAERHAWNHDTPAAEEASV